MDDLDRAILGELRRNARISFRDLGAQVGLSANATAERVRRLERAGVIAGYTVIEDETAAGTRIAAYLDVRLRPGTPPEAFEHVVVTLPVVTDCAHVTGRYDYELRVVCRDAQQLDETIRTLKARAHVIESATRLALRVVTRRAAPA